MPAAAVIPAGAGLIGSFLSSNSSKNAAKSNQAQQSALDTQIEGIYSRLMGTFNHLMGAVNPAGALQTAKNFYTSEVQGGLSPAVTGAAESQFQQQNALNLNTLKEQIGPYTPNKGGLISDFQNNEIIGNVGLQQQLAAMNQGVRAQGAAGLTGVANDVLGFGENVGTSAASGLTNLANQFGLANIFNAQNAYANNPFSALANLPWGQIFPTTSPTTPQPGQGGLGQTGGTGGGYGPPGPYQKS